MSTIHLIVKQGPEWQVPVEAWTLGALARDEAKRLDAERKGRVEEARLRGGQLSPDEVMDSLSAYSVTQITLRGPMPG